MANQQGITRRKENGKRIWKVNGKDFKHVRNARIEEKTYDAYEAKNKVAEKPLILGKKHRSKTILLITPKLKMYILTTTRYKEPTLPVGFKLKEISQNVKANIKKGRLYSELTDEKGNVWVQIVMKEFLPSLPS